MLDATPPTASAARATLMRTAPGFTPGLPGLTKLVSKFSKEGDWRRALAVYHAVDALGLTADTTLTNAAITACGRSHDTARVTAMFDSLQVRTAACTVQLHMTWGRVHRPATMRLRLHAALQVLQPVQSGAMLWQTQP